MEGGWWLMASSTSTGKGAKRFVRTLALPGLRPGP